MNANGQQEYCAIKTGIHLSDAKHQNVKNLRVSNVVPFWRGSVRNLVDFGS